MIPRTVVEAALRARAKHPSISDEEIAHAISDAYGFALDDRPAVVAEILAAFRGCDRGES